MAKVPYVALVVGAALLVAAAGFVDWRLGCTVAGIACIAFGLFFDGDA